jgi:hypothetical protein
MFSASAKYYTTHELKREFAFRIIELSLFHNPQLFSKRQKNLCFPPFNKKSPIKWKRIKLKTEYDKEKEYPIKMDFRNYTIGSLIKGRRNYDDSHIVFKEVYEKILWRIYDLGYSLKYFKEIDKTITYSYPRGRIDNGFRKVDRYGKNILG